jgi:hypothetical protein
MVFFTDYYSNVMFANDNDLARWNNEDSLAEKMVDAQQAVWNFSYAMSKMYHPSTLAHRTEYLKTLDVPLESVAGFYDFGD